jgi:hypothetical protein
MAAQESESNPKRSGWQSRAGRFSVYSMEKIVVALSPVRRAFAIVAVCALLAAPLALVAHGEACAPENCKKLCCRPHPAPGRSHQTSGDVDCHHSSGQSAPECSMKSACNHALEFGFITPVPLTVLAAKVRLMAPGLVFDKISSPDSRRSSGFAAVPFEPPRS